MQRRKFIQQAAGFGWALPSWVKVLKNAAPGDPVAGSPLLADLDPLKGAPDVAFPMAGQLTGPAKPLFVYNNWSAYDELSDKVVQTEELAMRELQEILRLRQSGVQIDYYVMDAFWFDKRGQYRTWNREHWPNGPDRWLQTCQANKILPGMWFSSNLIATHDGRFLEPGPEWNDSVGTDPNILCLFEGGYLPHLSETLQKWYDRGVRLFKFDFAYFEAVTPLSKDKFTPEEIKEKNKVAFMSMLQQFRARNKDVLITGYNGFGGDMENTYTPFRRTVDSRWLDTFDTLYCGDPRFSDVPMMNAWRSQDTYSDHMVRQFEFNGLPLRRIDSCAFMIGKTGTCYYRGHHGWKGMLLLELARGGWMNVYHGNLELLDHADANWFARAQRLYHPLQQKDNTRTFGAIPGTGKPYGYVAQGSEGLVYTIVNPSQEIVTVPLPAGEHMPKENPASTGTVTPKTDHSSTEDPAASPIQILYADRGFTPSVTNGHLTLGAEQLVVFGTGIYTGKEYWLSGPALAADPDICIARTQQKIDVSFSAIEKNKSTASVNVVPGKDLRILFQQLGEDGFPVRSWGGSPPDGQKMSALLTIRARQGDKEIPLTMQYDKVIWSGLSWAAAELRQDSFDPQLPVYIECMSTEKLPLKLGVQVYAVTYQD